MKKLSYLLMVGTSLLAGCATVAERPVIVEPPASKAELQQAQATIQLVEQRPLYSAVCADGAVFLLIGNPYYVPRFSRFSSIFSTDFPRPTSVGIGGRLQS